LGPSELWLGENLGIHLDNPNRRRDDSLLKPWA
jgi:hypothetical protein